MNCIIEFLACGMTETPFGNKKAIIIHANAGKQANGKSPSQKNGFKPNFQLIFYDLRYLREISIFQLKHKIKVLMHKYT